MWRSWPDPLTYGTCLTTITVPVLSVSGSWLTVGSYAPAFTVIPVTVNVTDVVDFGMEAFEMEHVPAVDVLQVAVPLAPPDHEPVTVTALALAWLALWTRIVTVAVHDVDLTLRVPSRSATCTSVGEVTVMLTVAGVLHELPSDVRYVNEFGSREPGRRRVGDLRGVRVRRQQRHAQHVRR